MDREPLIVIREVRASLSDWLDEVRRLPDPTAQPHDIVRRISAQILSVDRVLRGAPPSVRASAEWKSEIAAYTEVLRELRARLNNFEITLRIRHNGVRNQRAKLGAVRSWSDLAKQIG
jgi:hypothetical protein